LPSPLYQYIVVIRNEHSRYINFIGFLLAVGSVVLFIRELVLANKMDIPLVLGIVFIVGVLIWNFHFSRKPGYEVYYSKALLIAGLVWTKMPYFQWLIFVFILLALLEYQAKHPLEIGFSNEQVTFNTLFKKRYSWTQLNNVILKDGLLTVDFTDNRIFQKEVNEGESEATEEEFNAWCRQQLEKSAAVN
jgi:hypothetical protein